MENLIIGLGYAVVRRHECRLVREGEQWVGTGDTPEDALRQAIAQACPSFLAQELLKKATEVSTLAIAIPESTSPFLDNARVEEMLQQQRREGPLVETPAKLSIEETLQILDHRNEHEGSAPVPETALSIGDALGLLKSLSEEIEAASDDLGMQAPIRQRIVLTGWLAEIRSIEDLFAESDRVADKSRALVGTLNRLSKTWWPGSVNSLALKARPSDASNELCGDPRTATTWEAVARLAEKIVAEFDDTDGWSDAERCSPPPPDPTALLDGVVHDLSETDNPFPEQLAAWVARLRWIRPHIVDAVGFQRWAAAMGRCRQFVAKNRTEYHDANKYLNPSFALRPWSQIVKLPAPVAPAPVLAPLPTLDAEPSDEVLSEWLVQVLPMKRHAEMVAALRPHSARVLSLVEPKFGRHDRRRWSKLLLALAGKETPIEVEAEVSVTPVAEPEAERTTLVDHVRLSVMAKTRGKRALLVGNRDNSEASARLVEELQFANVEQHSSEPRRVQSAADAIASGRYDIVLGATGFISHQAVGILSKACTNADVPFVRVAKGRVGACVQALAKFYGVAG